MKILIDNEIPFIEGIFEEYAEVIYKDGESISGDDVKDADAIIVRTRTKCDSKLLEGSAVKMIATATTDTSHIDTEYCSRNGLFVQNAAGSNAGGVANYVCSALYGAASRKGIHLDKATFGIIGLGSVGSRVEMMMGRLGFKVLRYDPCRAQSEGPGQFCDLDFLLRNSDIISIHAPLNEKTENLADSSFFSKMKLGAFFINTSSGNIVVEEDLIDAIPKLGAVAIDVWRNEPDINLCLMEKVDIATPHIAGYSYQGKQNSTAMVVRAVARFFGFKKLFDFYPPTEIASYRTVKLDLIDKNQGERASIIQYNYPIFTDDFMFRISPGEFKRLRDEYQYRIEFNIE